MITDGDEVTLTRIAWNPWLTWPNLGSEGFKFNIPYIELKRLTPIPIPVFERAVIGSTTGTGFAPTIEFLGRSAPAKAARTRKELQMPAETMQMLLTAYSSYGIVELKSLACRTTAEFIDSMRLYHTVMQSLECLTLEAMVIGDAENLPLRLNATSTFVSKNAEIPGRLQGRVELLEVELLDGILRAHEKALNPVNGILPDAKKLLEATVNECAGGKAALDAVEVWAMQQFPSFDMDGLVAKAQRALAEAIASESADSRIKWASA